MVREGEYRDVPIMMELLEEAHRTGKYKDYAVEAGKISALLVTAIQRKKVRGEGGTCVFVWDDEGVQGLIIGAVEPIYHVAKEFRATDIFFYIARKYKSPRAFVALLRAFEAWAWENLKVKKIDLGVTDIIGEPRRLATIYRRFGYNECGVMLTKGRAEPF